MYDLKPLEHTAETVATVQSLLAEVFPGARHLTRAYLDWQYNQNPVGRAVGYNAWAGDELAAHYVTLPMVALLDGQVTRGVLSLNTGTRPAHQGKGLFKKLAEATFAKAKEDGYAFVVGVANANSTPGFMKMNFQLVAPLEARLGVGRLARDPSRARYAFEPSWTAEALRWRLANPERRYHVSVSRDVARVLAPTGKAGIQAILAERPAGELPHTPRVPALNPTRLWLGIDPAIDWKRSRFYTIPKRLRPSPLNLIFRDLTGGGRRLAPDAMRFEAIDFDAY